MKRIVVACLVCLVAVVTLQVFVAYAKDEKSSGSQNITTPGPEGGSCSATSDDKNKTCSITCPKGKAAICSSTRTSASCKCER